MNKQLAYLLILILVLVAVFAPATVAAQGQPPLLPHAFFGAVEVNGNPAPAGAQIEARGAGVRSGIEGNPLLTTVAGRYGGPTLYEAKLGVQGAIEEGAPIEFFVDGVKAECARPGGPWQSSYPFEPGVVTDLNLRVGQAPPPTATATPVPPTALPPTATPVPPPTATPTTVPATATLPPAVQTTPTASAASAANVTSAAAATTVAAGTAATPAPAATLPQGDPLPTETAIAAAALTETAQRAAGQETPTAPLLPATAAASPAGTEANAAQDTATPQVIAQAAEPTPDVSQAQLVRPTATPRAGDSGDSENTASLLAVVLGGSFIGAALLAVVLVLIWRRR